jgi:hypothetical protein
VDFEEVARRLGTGEEGLEEGIVWSGGHGIPRRDGMRTESCVWIMFFAMSVAFGFAARRSNVFPQWTNKTGRSFSSIVS